MKLSNHYVVPSLSAAGRRHTAVAMRTVVLALFLCAALPLAAQTAPDTTATFSSTLQDFPNPERGFAKEWENLSDLDAAWLVALHDAGYRLVTHRQLLSNYVNTPTLPQSFLDALNAGAALHRATGTKMVMQFSYDNVGGAPEPMLTTILDHIAQLQPFFTANADVIAAVHGGFLGTWGEWGFSTDPTVGNPTPTPAARAAVRDALLAAVDPSTPIGFRTVADLMTWFPTPLDASQAFTGTVQARSGLHNDCFLNNPDDSGTYWAPGVSPTGRTPADNVFRLYHSQMSNATTSGGELCGTGQYTDCSYVLTDGPLYHWRYLRDDWGTVFFDGWKTQGCYPQIRSSLGYRFQLDAISHPQSAAPGGVANVAVDLRDVGWSGIFSARKLVVTLQNTTSGALITGSTGDMRLLPPNASASTEIVVPVAIPAGAAPGDYDVYVDMPDIWPGTAGKADYAVRFANADDSTKGQAWDAANFRFKTGTTLTVSATTQPTPAADTIPPSVPTNLAAVAVSSNQINLSWTASTDNVGVVGYYVYPNDATLAVTTATSFQHTGLTPGTTYNYRVSSYDAAKNNSAWTATPVSATTPPASDTTAPSVPTGLTATAVSSTQINLTWNAATDNVGVTGYYVYLNDVALATTAATSFQHTGLTPGTTYNYRVSSYDAAKNNSAWTATPVSVTTPIPALAITSFQPTADANNDYYRLAYTGSPSRIRVFLDTDMNAGTGYPIKGTGANYLVEIGLNYGNLYSYSGTGGAWGWRFVKPVAYTNANGVANITMRRHDVGSPSGVDLIAAIAGSSTTVYTAKVSL